VVVVIATSRYVRSAGLAKPVAGGVGPIGLAVAFATTALGWLGLGLAAPGLLSFGPLLGLALGHGLMRLFFEPKLGGYTGDCLGAVQQASELGFYLGLLASVKVLSLLGPTLFTP
jgi:adenosylcobinamide-GDP ribazoletransferase